jgi:hypothetical protein
MCALRLQMPTGQAEVYVDFVIKETSKGELNEGALLCEVGGKQVWVPKAAIHDDSDVYKDGQSGILLIPEKLAIKKELV